MIFMSPTRIYGLTLYIYTIQLTYSKCSEAFFLDSLWNFDWVCRMPSYTYTKVCYSYHYWEEKKKTNKVKHFQNSIYRNLFNGARIWTIAMKWKEGRTLATHSRTSSFLHLHRLILVSLSSSTTIWILISIRNKLR